MQARTQPLPISGYPDLLVYPDVQDATRFYAFAARPRVARDDSGVPLINLVLFGKKSGDQMMLSGGQFSATFDLAITPVERTTIERQLQGSVIYPEWLNATMTLDLCEGVSIPGTPSLVGSNECVVAATLSASQATVLRDEWSHGLPQVRVCYEVTMRTSELLRKITGSVDNLSNETSRWSTVSRFDLQTNQVSRQQMTLKCGIAARDIELFSRVHMICL